MILFHMRLSTLLWILMAACVALGVMHDKFGWWL